MIYQTYDLTVASATFMLKGQKTVSVKMVSKPLIRSTHHEPEEITYESLDNDYSYPQPQDTKFGYKQSLYASDICSNEKNGHTEALYHEVGPDVGLKSVSENTSTALPLPTRDVMGTKQTAYGISVVPPLPARNVMDTEKDGGNLYHVLESPSKDSGGTYEDPLSPTHNFKVINYYYLYRFTKNILFQDRMGLYILSLHKFHLAD